jgi:heme exporter protein B
MATLMQTELQQSRLPSETHAIRALLRRELLLAWRRRADALFPVLYALIVVSLFPFALGPDDALLARISGGVLLVTVLLAMLPSLESLFRGDLEDGSLEQMLLAPQPLPLLVLIRVLAHWATTTLPLIVVMPLLAVLLRLPLA